MFVLPSGTACATRRRVPFFRVRACSEIFGARWLAFSAVGALGAPVQYAGASLRSFVWHRPFAFPDVRAGLGSSVWHRPLSSPNFRASHSFPSSSCSRFFSSKKNGKKNSHMQLEFLKAEQKEEERNRKEDERTKRCEKIQDEKNKTTAYYLVKFILRRKLVLAALRYSYVSQAGVVFFTLAMSYAAVPLYRIFCQVTGFGGTVQQTHGGVAKLSEDLSKTKCASSCSVPCAVLIRSVRCPVDALGSDVFCACVYSGSPPRTIKINFNADTDADMPWTFKPSQGSIWVISLFLDGFEMRFTAFRAMD